MNSRRFSIRVFTFRFIFLTGCLLWVPALSAANPIQTENTKVGTTAWQLSNPATNREIEGYASLTSVNRGSQISFFVNTAESSYRIEIYRLGWYNGAGGRLMQAAVTRTGTRQQIPVPNPTTGLIECNWINPYVLTVPTSSDPTNWASGVYLAKLTALTSGKQAYMIFVVRDDARASDYLFQSSVTTFQAYNAWGGKSLYGSQSTNGVAAVKVSFNRPYLISPTQSAAPGVGAGEFLSNQTDPGSSNGAGWEVNMVRFLEREGFDVTYCTDVDTHANANLLLTHKGFLSVGHDEYWSWQMRTNVESALSRGVSLGFFSANDCYWQIRFESSLATGAANRTIVAYKDRASLDPILLDGIPTNDYLTTTRWRDYPVNRPEVSLIGVMYGSSPVNGDLVIYDASQWVCSGTGLTNGTRLPGLVGSEIDGLDGTSPAGIALIAHSFYGTYSDTTAYTAPSGATVFATGSFQWSWGLDDYNVPSLRYSVMSSAAQQMTRNVLARFVGDTFPIANAGGPYTGTIAQTIQFNGSGSSDQDGTISNYQWSFGDGTIGTGMSPTHAYFALGAYNVTLTITDNKGAAHRVATSATVAPSTSLQPIADARVRDLYPNTNYGTATGLSTRFSSVNSDYRSYFKFDLSSIPSNLSNAKLRLFGSLSDTSGSNVATSVYSVPGTTWTETGITWNNQPASSTSPLATVTVTNTTARFYDWDITNYIRSEKTAGRNVVSLALKSTTDTTAYTIFNSREASTNMPQLVITLPTPTPTPTPSPTPPGICTTFPCTNLLDNFNRPNFGPPLSTSWIEPCQPGTTGSFSIMSNQAVAASPGSISTCWNAAFGPNVEVYAKIVSIGYTYPALMFRINNVGLPSFTGYEVAVVGNLIKVVRFDSSTVANYICSDINQTVSNGDSLGATMIGSLITVYYKPGAGSWANVGTCVDSTYSTAGRIGLDAHTYDVFDDFGGGNR